MPYASPTCQPPSPRVGDSHRKSPSSDGTPCPSAGLRVPPALQWVTTTTGRIATCAHSWMQSVHWVVGSGLYVPTRAHGPRGMNATTIAIAQEISALTECRPGVDYLARKLSVAERTVQYHLDMLREAGLLAYRSKGTRAAGRVRQASVFERIVPVEFDTALGIRTVGDGTSRRPVGIAEQGRKLIGKLASKAARRPRRKRTKRPVEKGLRCTPMQGGTSTSSPTGTTCSPSENNLASGQADHPTPKKPTSGPRTLNRVGRRYQLARELTTQVPWLGNASVPRIAWITRHVADNGWTARHVQAIAEMGGPLTTADVRRCSGLLAHRLKGVHQLYRTPAQRERLVVDWQDSRAAERARHDGYDHGNHAQPQPMFLRNLITASVRRVQALTIPAPAPVPDDAPEVFADTTADIDSLDPATIQMLRAAAEADPGQIRDALESGMPLADALRVYGHRLVDLARRATAPATTIRIHTWQEATHA